MLFFHQNNWVFARTTQRQHDSCSFFSTSAPVFCNKPLLSSSMWISPRRSINSGTTVYFKNWPNELSTSTSDLHYRIPEELKVLHQNESNHLKHLRDRERSASGFLPWTDPISSLSLWNGSTDSFSPPFASVRRWPRTDHPSSPWWHRTEFVLQMQRTGQKTLNEAHAYAAGWKQPINFPKTEWQGIHRQVVLPTLSLSRSANIS